MANTVFPVYVSLGTNIEPRQDHLHEGLRNLRGMVKVVRLSSIYQTKPWGFSEQADFLNLVVECETDTDPFEFLKQLKAIETKMGRKETFRYGPRVIDLDILIYGSLVLHDNKLTIPHASLTGRAFVLIPLAELNPDLVLPGGSMRIRDYLDKLDQNGVTIWRENGE